MVWFDLSPCGLVRWRIPYRTHHAIHVDDQGNFWAPGEISWMEESPKFRNYDPPFEEFTILKISSDGAILMEISINSLLEKNGLTGLLHMSTIVDHRTNVSGDTLHLNDVETFSTSMSEGKFKHGDVLISMRNINTILVFDPESLDIRYIKTGAFLRQHDPDFIDGNTISVFDNNNTLNYWFDNREGSDLKNENASRIVMISAKDDSVLTVFEGSPENPFFTNIMGTHQALANGNTLITEAVTGRAFEITKSGQVIWEYFNIVGSNQTAVVDDAQRLPQKFDLEFFKKIQAICKSSTIKQSF